MKTNFDKALMKNYLKGRTLWCASQLAEIIPKDYTDMIMDILNLSKDVLIEEKIVSVKLVATRCLVKFSRKLKSDILIDYQKEKFEQILE